MIKERAMSNTAIRFVSRLLFIFKIFPYVKNEIILQGYDYVNKRKILLDFSYYGINSILYLL